MHGVTRIKRMREVSRYAQQKLKSMSTVDDSSTRPNYPWHRAAPGPSSKSDGTVTFDNQFDEFDECDTVGLVPGLFLFADPVVMPQFYRRGTADSPARSTFRVTHNEGGEPSPLITRISSV